MIFNSYTFAIFFAVVYALYLLLMRRHRAQNDMLLVASYIFYGVWSWKFLLLLIGTQVIDHQLARRLQVTSGRRRRLALVWISVALNMGNLAFFKYYNFFIANLEHLFSLFHITIHTGLLHVILPVGISFYTIQEMTYIIDVYKERVVPAKRFRDFALFVSYFPQLVAGPIERAENLLPQILAPRTLRAAEIHEGGWLIFWGLYKKVFVADNLAILADRVFNAPHDASALQTLLGIYAFAFQIYCDFSGYSDIARGLGKMMGIHIMHNFNLPYFASNPADFWHRWHISLSECLRDNLYIPLGGNRRGVPREYWNLMVTMTIGGLWHGAQWHFVLWGIFHGIILIFHRLTRAAALPFARLRAGKTWKAFCIFVMFQVTCLGWLLFRAPDMHHVGTMLHTLFTGSWSIHPAAFDLLFCGFFLAVLIPMQFTQYLSGKRYPILNAPLFFRVFLYILLYFSLTLWAPESGRLFIYFQF